MVFYSGATNLVASDTNGFSDVFVHVRSLNITIRVSVSSAGVQANGGSVNANISADGQFVVFQSDATNLVANDTNGSIDIFVRNLANSTTTRVSVDSAGNEADNSSTLAEISGNGRYVAFVSNATNLVSGDTNGLSDAFVHDQQTATTTRVSVSTNGDEADGASTEVKISDNGLFVVFQSGATNLIVGDTNGLFDIFVHNRLTGRTERISIANDGSQSDNSSFNPHVSADGRYFGFRSNATNLVPNDTNAVGDIFVFTRAFRVLLPLLER